MMKRLYRITALALVMLICLSAFAVSAFAAEPQNLTLSAKVTITGPKPSPAEKYTVVLERLDSNNPMPAGSKDGKYNLTITGAGKEDFPAIEFTTVGIYQYKIYQIPGKAPNASYDRRVYVATVYVLNSETDDDSMTITVVLNEEKSKDKSDEVVFVNKYTYNPKTGDDSNIVLYASLCGLFAIALGAALVVLNKKKV